MQEGEQQRDSTTHTHVTILPQIPPPKLRRMIIICVLFFI